MSEPGYEGDVFAVDVEVVDWRIGDPGAALIPRMDAVPGAYDKTAEDPAEWRQVTPGGLDLFEELLNDAALRFPRPEDAGAHRTRALFLWCPLLGVLGLALALRGLLPRGSP